MPTPEAAPRQHKLTARIPAQAAGATVAGEALGEVSEDGTVSSIIFTPDGTVTGATATKRTMTVVNRGQDGTGNVVVGTLDFTTGTNAPIADDTAFTLSGVAGARNVVAGDVLALQEAITSTGTANPGGLITVLIDRR